MLTPDPSPAPNLDSRLLYRVHGKPVVDPRQKSFEPEFREEKLFIRADLAQQLIAAGIFTIQDMITRIDASPRTTASFLPGWNAADVLTAQMSFKRFLRGKVPQTALVSKGSPLVSGRFGTRKSPE